MSKNSKNKSGNKSASATPAQIQAMLQQAWTHHQSGQVVQAKTLYENVLKIQPTNFDALRLLGYLAYQTGNPQIAIQLISKAIEINPNFVVAYLHLALSFQALHRFEEALGNFDKAIALEPNNAELHTHRGNVLATLQRLELALLSYDRAIAIQPDYVWAYNNRGNVLLQLNRLNDALNSYEKAIALKPDFAAAYNNYGNALVEAKRFNDALIGYGKAITLQPNYADAHNNLGNTLANFKRLEEALLHYDKAVALNPQYAEAYTNRGNALRQLKRFDEALTNYDKAIALNPNYADAYSNRGVALTELRRLDTALASYDKAIALNPNYADAYVHRGVALNDLKRPAAALESYKKAFALNPDHDFLLGNLLYTKMMICDWTDLDSAIKNLEENILHGKKTTPPFPTLSLLDSPKAHQKTAEILAETQYPKTDHLGPIKKQDRNKRIRIGYYSADFHNHATSALMAELFEAHDADQFELFGFSFGPNKNDEMRQRVSSAFNHFFDVGTQSDHSIAQRSRELGIDIAIDLKGFTADSRMGIFAERCAPIQVNYLGYPGTVGADYMDYLIADETVIPEESQTYYSEKIIYLPYSYQVNDSKRRISDREFTREELGLPESGFVFCCFNNNYKILPSMFDVWMRILKAVDDSVLWLLEDNLNAAENLRKEAVLRGIDSNRLVFAQRLPLDEHLARHRFADLFIDTLPCNAHTTASDALWAGLPVLTCAGKSFASRVAASLLDAIELPELITHSLAEYESKAIALALNTEQLAAIKCTLENHRLTKPLFNGKLFAKYIEQAYTAMYERHQAGLLPEMIKIQA